MAKRHYAVHEGKPFFEDLVKYIISTPIVAIVFEGENAIELIRKTMGATDPKKAEKGTIRADFGLDIQNNAVHGTGLTGKCGQRNEAFLQRQGNLQLLNSNNRGSLIPQFIQLIKFTLNKTFQKHGSEHSP